MRPSDDGVEAVWKRVVLTLSVALLVVLVSASSSFMLSAPPESVSLDTPEYDLQSVAVEPLRATGQVEADASVGSGSGVVVVDDDHGNNVDRAEIAPLVEALVLAGYEVDYFDGDNLTEALDGASAYVVVDPSTEYDAEERATLEEFTDRGGHLLLVGEPDRRQISATLFGTSVSTEESAVTTVAATYGIGFGTQYLYDLEENDGNYRHVIAVPTGEGFDGSERVTLYTATTVESQTGTPVLETVPTTRLSNSDEQRSYTVALVDGNVMAVADASFFTAGRHNVADNERFIASMVEFLIAGEAVTLDESTDTDAAEDDEESDDGGDGTDTEAETPEESETPANESAA
jgi:hypothetical protein